MVVAVAPIATKATAVTVHDRRRLRTLKIARARKNAKTTASGWSQRHGNWMNRNSGSVFHNHKLAGNIRNSDATATEIKIHHNAPNFRRLRTAKIAAILVKAITPTAIQETLPLKSTKSGSFIRVKRKFRLG